MCVINYQVRTSVYYTEARQQKGNLIISYPKYQYNSDIVSGKNIRADRNAFDGLASDLECQ